MHRRIPRLAIRICANANELAQPVFRRRRVIDDSRAKRSERTRRAEICQGRVRAPHPVCARAEGDAVDGQLRFGDDVLPVDADRVRGRSEAAEEQGCCD